MRAEDYDVEAGYEDDDFYYDFEEALEDDEITPEEEGFMSGFCQSAY